jgi:DNA invertase Pin-like site-specific DNA recombinase
MSATRFVLYAAKSTEDTHGSIPAQLRECREYATRLGGEIIGEFSDEAASGFKRSRGPGLVKAKETAAAEAATGADVTLLVFASDRLARGDGAQAAHLVEHLLDARKAGYALDAVTESLGDLAMAALLGERAHMDSKVKGEHVRRGQRAAAERGKRHGGPRPFGYGYEVVGFDEKSRKAITELVPIPKEATAVVRAFQEALAGTPQAAIARGFNGDGITTTRGHAWHQSQIKDLLRSRLYIGEVQYRGDWYPAAHDPIVPVELFDAVQLLSKPAPVHRGGRPMAQPFLLGHGLLKCGYCGSTMRVRTKPKSTRVGERWRTFYECMGRRGGMTDCQMPAITRDRIDPHVFAYFEQVGLDVDATLAQIHESVAQKRSEITAQLHHAETEAARAKTRLARVRRDYHDGKLDADDWREHKADLTDELQAADAAVAQLTDRLDDLDRQGAEADAETEGLEFLAALRASVAGGVTDAPSVEAASNALRTVFQHFVLHYRPAVIAAAKGEIADDDPSLDAEREAEDAKLAGPGELGLDLGSHYLEPVPRQEAVVTPWKLDDDGEIEQWEALRKVAISRSTSGVQPQPWRP